jgi:hypothetical protein
MAYIATKTPDGRHYHRRYVKAHHDLKMAVLKAATTLDHADDESMMKMADSCAFRLQKKGIAFPAIPIMWWLYGAMAAGTAVAMFGAAAPSAKNVAQACNLVVTQVGEMGAVPYAQDIKTDVSVLGQAATIFAGVSGEVTTLDNAEASVSESKLKDMENKVTDFAEKAQAVSGQIGTWLSDVDKHAKDDTSTESGWWSKLRSMTGFLGAPFGKETKMKQTLNVLQRKIAESSGEQARILSFVQRKRIENKASSKEPDDEAVSLQLNDLPKAAKVRTSLVRRRG